MRFQVVNVIYHNFVPIKQEGNVMLARCDCCKKPRLAVYIISGQKRIYFFSGYDEKMAQMHFSSLVKRQNSQSQD